MLNSKLPLTFFGAAVAVLSLTSTANALSLGIANASFESPVAPLQSNKEFYSNNDIDSWQVFTSIGGGAGVFNPGASQGNTGKTYFNSSVPDGNQTAYINSGSIFQQLTATLTGNTNYLLSVFVGKRNDAPLAGYNVELLAGGTVLASNNSVIPGLGDFAEVLVPYTSSSSDPLLGQALGIRLSARSAQANFDKVSLSATAVPTPALLPGLVGMGVAALRKRKNDRAEAAEA